MTIGRALVAGLLVTSFSLSGCGDRPARSGSGATTAAATQPAAATTTRPVTIDGVLARTRATSRAPGAMAVVEVDGRRWFGAAGAADLAGTAITDRTRFRIASITKPIVAALVLGAVDRGELSLDDEVDDLLPGVIRAEPPVRVRMLLDHTSGIFDEINEGDAAADVQRLADPLLRAEATERIGRAAQGMSPGIASDRLLVALAETHQRYFPPGGGYHYSNTNYQAAAMVLEKVTGTSLAELLHSRVVTPLDLKRTSVAPPDAAPPELRGYGVDESGGPLVDQTDDLLAFGNGGNGGIISTPDELLAMLRAVVTGRLFDQGLVAAMEAATSRSSGTYGLGLARYSLRCGTFYGHGGGVNGTISIAMVSPDGRSAIAIALNARAGSDPDMVGLAEELLCGAQEGHLVKGRG